MSDTTIAAKTKVKKYAYYFGIDNIEIKNINTHETMCFISDEIMINDNKYIQLSSDYYEGDNGSIEFYIIDGSDEKAILPIETEAVNNEKIFFNTHTRFTIDNNKKTIIKEKGIIKNITLDQAQMENNSDYTISYIPLNAHNVNIKSNSIRIKIILRTYDKNAKAPYINKINIKKFKQNRKYEVIN